MKKIAFFVEGQAEQIFINKLLIEIAGQKNIAINLFQLRGGSSLSSPVQEIFIPQGATYSQPVTPKYEALIYDSGNDDKVKSDILDQMSNLAANGYSEIIGIRDLFPLPISDLALLERGLRFVHPTKLPLPIPFDIIVAVNEIETWFLAQCSHFLCIDSKLTQSYIKANTGLDPCIDDMTLIPHPSQTLKEIYQKVGKSYTKRKINVTRTVDCIDYANLYLVLRQKMPKLNQLITKIDSFLS